MNRDTIKANAPGAGDGFTVCFASGYTLSVQWKRGNYCGPNLFSRMPGEAANSVEILMMKLNGEEVPGCSTRGWTGMADLVRIMHNVSLATNDEEARIAFTEE